MEKDYSDEERENLINDSEAGVVVLDCENYRLLYSNKAADCFLSK